MHIRNSLLPRPHRINDKYHAAINKTPTNGDYSLGKAQFPQGHGYLIVLHSWIGSVLGRLGPTSAGHETSAEGEAGIEILVLPPGAEGHHDNCAVVL